MKKIHLLLVSLFLVIAAVAQDDKQTFTRKILIEQFTGASCGWCPWGSERIDSALADVNNVVWVKYHAGFGTDFLTNDIATAMTVFYGGNTFAPAVMIDRTRTNSGKPGPVMSVGQVSVVRRQVIEARQVATTCKLYTPEVSYNSATRHLSGTVTGRFGDDSYNDRLRLVVFIVEDSIVGNQSDYVNGNHTAYVHTGTVRDAVTDMWGDPFTVNDDPEHSFSYPIDYTLPTGYAYKNCRVVALVWQYDPDDINNCPVLNAAQSEYLDRTLGIGEVADGCALRLFPNPAHDIVTVETSALPATTCHIDILDAAGRRLLSQPAASATVQLSISHLPAGLYILRLTTPDGTATRQLVKH